MLERLLIHDKYGLGFFLGMDDAGKNGLVIWRQDPKIKSQNVSAYSDIIAGASKDAIEASASIFHSDSIPGTFKSDFAMLIPKKDIKIFDWLNTPIGQLGELDFRGETIPYR